MLRESVLHLRTGALGYFYYYELEEEEVGSRKHISPEILV